MQYTKLFIELSKKDADIAGGKGASLGEMTQAGISVPPGFVILAGTFDHFLRETNLTEEIDAILEKVDHKATHTIEEASKSIEQLIKKQEFPKDIKFEVLEQFKILNSKFVAVRSSATAEDGAENAWAGQLESYLNTTEETLLENIKNCWASLFTPRAIFYRFEKGLHKTHISVAVVIQRMINSEKSGVAFSVHPVTEDYNQLIIEAGFGLGEAIVSGAITPDSYVVEKEPRKIININVSTQDKGLYRLKNGGNEWVDITMPKASSQVLTESQILEFSNLIMKIENHYKFPCDIEWAFEKGKFYIVQSRPITTLSKKVTKIQEVSPTWTKILTRNNSVFMDSMKLYASTNIFNDFGYDYRLKNYKIINGENYITEDYETLVESLKDHLIIYPKFLFEIIKNAFKDIDNYKKIWLRIQKTETKNLSNCEISKLFQEYLQSLYGLMAYLFLPLSAEKILTKQIQSFLKSRLPESEISSVFQKIAITSKRSLVSEEQIEFLNLVKNNAKKVSVFNTYLFEKHLNKWAWLGDHFFQGTFWTMEDLIPRFNNFINKSSDGEIKHIVELEKSQRSEAEALCKKLNLSKEEIEIIHLAQDYVHLRTYRLDMLFYSQFLVKDMLNNVGDRLNLSYTDLILLTPQEITNNLNKHSNMRKIIEQRRRNYAIVVKDYKVEVYSGDKVEIFREFAKIDTEIIKGTVSYPGNVRGKARIILMKSDFNKLQEGDILVTHMTTPDFVPLMKKCAAIITDEGGITCHAAIVSRELQRPCIIGTKIATKILKDGDLVELNTNNGFVKIIEKSKINTTISEIIIEGK